jgi:hypothetical protein
MNIRRFTSLLTLVFALCLAAAPALAQTDVIDRAADELRSDPVYVDESAEVAPTDAEAEELRQAIDEVDGDTGPIFVAVLPESAGEPEQTIEELARTLGEEGTYIQILGQNLQVGSTEGVPIDPGTATEIGEEAVREYGGNTAGPLLLDVVDRLDAAASGEGADTSSDEGGGGGISWGFLGFLLLLLLGGGFFFLRRRRAREEEERAHLEEVRGTVLEDLASLNAANEALDLDLRLANPSPETKQDALTGVESYARASRAIDEARRVTDFQAATEAIEEGMYAVASARARLEGREPPERRVPCFFDPRHGPSVRDVIWAPPGGQPREVPACAADAIRIEEGEEPAAREVTVDGQRRPYWDAPGYYGPWAGGYYGANTGFLSGLLLGSWFGGGWGWGGWGGGYYGGGDAGGGGDGGDFGGGGGDFGGFGGGDFGGGGGDFGG